MIGREGSRLATVETATERKGLGQIRSANKLAMMMMGVDASHHSPHTRRLASRNFYNNAGVVTNVAVIKKREARVVGPL